MSRTGKVIDLIIRDRLAPHLKTTGFRKYARTYTRELDTFTQIVNVQASQWNMGGDGQFTLNLSIYIPSLERRFGRPTLEASRLKEYHGSVRTRIGSAMPQKTDHWWGISDDSDIQVLAQQVAETYISFGEPWLDKWSSMKNIASLDHEISPIVAAAAALELDDSARAKAILCAALNRQSYMSAAVVRQFAERNDVLIDP